MILRGRIQDSRIEFCLSILRRDSLFPVRHSPTIAAVPFKPQAELVKQPVPANAASATAVLIADSNRMQSELLTSALRRHAAFHISTCPLDTLSILEAIASNRPQIAVLSVNPTADAADAVVTLRRLHLSHPEIPKVLLVDSCDRELAIGAFRSGARGIFPITQANLRLLCKCLVRVADGQIWANTEQLNYLLDSITEVPSLRVLNSSGNSLLTPREEQVVALVAEGMGNREIANELSLSEHTVKKYLYRVFEKLGVSTRVELVLYALNHGDARPAEWMAGAARSRA